MLQILQSQKNGEIVVEEMPMPNCPENGILVKVHYSLISAGTEKASVDNAKGTLIDRARKQPDQVKQVIDTVKQHGIQSTIKRVKNKLNSYKQLGYSAAGEVIQSKTDDFSVGDRVAIGGAGIANHAEICAVPKNLAVKLSPDVSYLEGTYTTVGSIAMQGVRQASPKLGESVAVIGLGLLGVITVQLLKANGCRVVGLDINPELFAQAKKFGCDETFISHPGSKEDLLAFARGEGFDSVIITASTSSDEPLQLAMEVTRKKGSVVIVGAVGMNLKRNPWYLKEIDLKISSSYGPGRYDSNYEHEGQDYPFAYVRWTENRNMQSFVDLLDQKMINVKDMTSKSFMVDKAPEAYSYIAENKDYLGIAISYFTNKEHGNKYVFHDKKKTYDKPNIALVGAGSFAQNYIIPELKKSDLNLYGVSTNTPISSKNVAESQGFDLSSTDSFALINDPKTDIVFIASQHYSHGEYVIEALNQSKPVFVEKPLCVTEGELETINELYQKREGRVMTGFNRRFSQAFKEIKKFFSDASQPFYLSYRVNSGKIPKDHWVQNEKNGGRIIGEVCHFVDAVSFLSNSQPDEVHAYSFSGDDSTMLNDDNVTISLKMDNGSIARIDYISSGPKAMSKEYLEVISSGKSAIMDNFKSIKLISGTGISDKKLDGKKGIDKEIRSFLDNVKAGKQEPIPFKEQYITTKTCFKILESLEKGIPLPIK